MATKTAKHDPIEIFDFAPAQVELQRGLEAVRDLVDKNLEGLVIKGIPVRKPTGKVVVTFDTIKGSHAKRAGVYGHFAPNRYNVDGDTVDHIAFNPYRLVDGSEQVGETLVHEYVHLALSFSGIKDTSRQGTYHNKNYQAAADATKVIVSVDDPKIGCTTELTDAGRSWLREELQLDFSNLTKILEARPASKEPTTVQFECPFDGNKATVSKKQFESGFVPMCGHDHEPEWMEIIIK